MCPRRCLEGKKKPASKWMEPPSCNGWGFCARLPIVSAVRTDLRKIGWLCPCVWSSRLAVCIGMTASNASSRWHLGGRNCRKPLSFWIGSFYKLASMVAMTVRMMINYVVCVFWPQMHGSADMNSRVTRWFARRHAAE